MNAQAPSTEAPVLVDAEKDAVAVSSELETRNSVRCITSSDENTGLVLAKAREEAHGELVEPVSAPSETNDTRPPMSRESERSADHTNASPEQVSQSSRVSEGDGNAAKDACAAKASPGGDEVRTSRSIMLPMRQTHPKASAASKSQGKRSEDSLGEASHMSTSARRSKRGRPRKEELFARQAVQGNLEDTTVPKTENARWRSSVASMNLPRKVHILYEYPTTKKGTSRRITPGRVENNSAITAYPGRILSGGAEAPRDDAKDSDDESDDDEIVPYISAG